MRLRVTDSMRRHLHDSKAAPKPGVMLVPGILSIEEWEAVAEPQQRALMEWSAVSHDGTPLPEPSPKPMTAAQERQFVHAMETSKRQREPLTDEQRAARAYARAIGIIR